MLDLLDQAIKTGVISAAVYQAFSFARYCVGARLVRYAIDSCAEETAIELARALQPGLRGRRREAAGEDDPDQAAS